MNKQRIFMLFLIVLIGILAVITFISPDLADAQSMVYATPLALLPSIIAITLALITKEVYTSLFTGIIMGALLHSNFNLEKMMNTFLFHEEGGMVYKLADSWNVGILIFLVLLGILVSVLNRAGGSSAFGRWATDHIKTRAGAQLATMVLGVLIFVDDYFNCLTVGSVMRPVTDRHKVSRAKLSYIIDATAAPVCIIAPISSWAAAVTSSVPEDANINGFSVFLQTIPYNLYAFLTLAMIIALVVMKFDFGPMSLHEQNAMKGDLLTVHTDIQNDQEENVTKEGAKVIDLMLPVIVLILSCIICMVYTGGFFSGTDFISAFANSDASQGLVLGGFITLIFTFIYMLMRNVITFKEFTECIPEGFKAMIAPILILTMAWTLSGMTNLLGAREFVAELVQGSAAAFQGFLPVIIFLVAAFLAFATGTSWGTFGILIPIVIGVFPEGQMMVISISACLAGAVAGDHCSPISDTTIMASAGGQCNHVSHVSTQLPYAITVSAVCCVGYILIGILNACGLMNLALLSLPVSIVVLISVLFVIRSKTKTEV
ncbi:MAG: Na+/H+ antiporter NhaC family protein [Lachnospiraceae bacterium]|nr:Na+/H+ antiporter NhaC family protein [Lachnospiraceae bacterium]